MITTIAGGVGHIYAIDIEGDGDMDVLSASVLDGDIRLHRNQGAGSWGLLHLATAGSGARSVYADDIDGNGSPDVLAVAPGNNAVLWIPVNSHSNGGTTIGAVSFVTTNAPGASDVFATDVDGDVDALVAFRRNKFVTRASLGQVMRPLSWMAPPHILEGMRAADHPEGVGRNQNRAPAGSVRSTRATQLDTPVRHLVEQLLARLQSDEASQDPTIRTRLLGELDAHLSIRVQEPLNRYSPSSSMISLQFVRPHPDFKPGWLRGKTCLEFGCGGLNPGGTMFAMLLEGARQAYAIDLDEIASIPLACRALYTLAAAAVIGADGADICGTAEQILDRVSTFDLKRLAQGDSGGIDTDRLRHIRAPIHKSGIASESVDLVSSNSVYEHLEDPDSVTAHLARVMRPGGLAVHAIDGFDHKYYADQSIHPLEFLRDKSSAPLVGGCNRMRPLAFADVFERHGLEVRGIWHGHRLTLTDDQVSSFSDSFRMQPREHLEVARARFYLRKR
ncbi:MAG: FG-GAP-like repeat-containing protein [Planctomycetota bacterium]